MLPNLASVSSPRGERRTSGACTVTLTGGEIGNPQCAARVDGDRKAIESKLVLSSLGYLK